MYSQSHHSITWWCLTALRISRHINLSLINISPFHHANIVHSIKNSHCSAAAVHEVYEELVHTSLGQSVKAVEHQAAEVEAGSPWPLGPSPGGSSEA